MHWYFALSEKSIDREHHDWRNLIRVAVQSAKANTTLKPHMLYDGVDNAFTQELRMLGVKVIFHRSSLCELFEKRRPGDMNYLGIASGAFLRFDIPIIEKSADYVLYTDCDVLFRCEPNFYSSAAPDFFSATSQTEKNPSHDMNSGVMLINIAAMKSIYPELIDFTHKNLHLGLDQEILRVFFDSRYTPMDMSLNWKPYWGVNPDAQIVHFHGPKPSSIQQLSADSIKSISPSWHNLFVRSPEGYARYTALWNTVLEDYKRDVFNRNAHGMVERLQFELERMTADRDRWRALAEQKL